MGFNTGTFHRLLLLGGLAYLAYNDKTIDKTNFGKAAIAEGGLLSASSSWLPDYHFMYGRLEEQYWYDPLSEKGLNFSSKAASKRGNYYAVKNQT